jgi:hypothetical protein
MVGVLVGVMRMVVKGKQLEGRRMLCEFWGLVVDEWLE